MTSKFVLSSFCIIREIFKEKKFEIPVLWLYDFIIEILWGNSDKPLILTHQGADRMEATIGENLPNWSLRNEFCLTQWSYELMWGCQKLSGHGGEFSQNIVHWRREWPATSVFLTWEPHEQYEKLKRQETAKQIPNVARSTRCPICWAEVHNTVQEVMIKINIKKHKKAKWLSEEDFKLLSFYQRREGKGNRWKEKIHLSECRATKNSKES